MVKVRALAVLQFLLVGFLLFEEIGVGMLDELFLAFTLIVILVNLSAVARLVLSCFRRFFLILDAAVIFRILL